MSVTGSVGGQSPIQTGQQGSHEVIEKAGPKAQGLNRSVEVRNHPNYLPPSPPLHSELQQSVPPDTSLHERKGEAVEGKKHLEKESSGTASPDKVNVKRVLKQKVAHVYGELKRFFKHENWKPVPRELIDGVRNKSLKQDLTTRNDKVEQLAELKGKANALEKKLVDFDQKYAKSLELYDRREAPPKEGKFPAPDGKTYDFSKAQLFNERKEMLNNFRDAFNNDAGFQSYDSDVRELRSTQDKRAELKGEIRELSRSLKLRVDSAASEKIEFRHQQLDRQMQGIQQKANKKVSQKYNEYRAEITKLSKAVVDKKEELAVQKREHQHRRDFEIPALKDKLKTINNMARQRLAEINDNKSLTPEQKQSVKKRVVASLSKQRDKFEGELKVLEGKVKAYSSDRAALKREYYAAIYIKAEASQGKDFKKEIDEISRGRKHQEKEVLEERKAVPKDVERERAALKKSLQGRMNSTGIKNR
ncbi:hypothetical protein [Endozoicomonas sp. SESOKO2]|uniref:hypothetical protein n=1 Tax=Endozoicomonas sp. SESOKO2 TaxID=2828743 RepID=UPI00214793AB|nr:hypothetical protein [Endozoicomonas sp. SESOKO2]